VQSEQSEHGHIGKSNGIIISSHQFDGDVTERNYSPPSQKYRLEGRRVGRETIIC
jgi:hypothetical protein